MNEVFGGQTVGFVTVTRGERGYLGIAEESRSVTLVSGCRFRQFTSTETPETETDVASEVWKCTAPPDAAALAAASSGEIVYDGTDSPSIPADLSSSSVFRIDGPIKPVPDMDGTIHHVTIMARRQAG